MSVCVYVCPCALSPRRYSFGVGQTVGENALLGGDEELRVVTCEALTNVEALRFDRSMFNWFLDE